MKKMEKIIPKKLGSKEIKLLMSAATLMCSVVAYLAYHQARLDYLIQEMGYFKANQEKMSEQLDNLKVDVNYIKKVLIEDRKRKQ